MTRKVQIVRFWLFVALALAWMLLASDPSFALIPVLFFPGQAGCFCCAASVASCNCCDVGTTQLEYEVTITGISDLSTCSECATINDTFIVTQDPGSSCTWRYTFSPELCGLSFSSLRFFMSFFLDDLSVTIDNNGAFPSEQIVWFNGSAGMPLNCDFSSYSVPFSGVSGTDCTSDGSACSITTH